MASSTKLWCSINRAPNARQISAATSIWRAVASDRSTGHNTVRMESMPTSPRSSWERRSETILVPWGTGPAAQEMNGLATARLTAVAGRGARILGITMVMASVRGAQLFVCLALLTRPVFAQTQTGEPETREALLQSEREKKQRATEPYRETGLERAMNLAENKILPLFQRDGVYAMAGSLTTGSAFAYRGGYRDRSLVRGRGSLDAWAARSVKAYWSVEIQAAYPLVEDESVSIEGYARRFTYPEEEYFGLGPDSERANQTTYTLRGTFAGGRLNWKPTARVTIGGGVEHNEPTVSHGEGRPPSVE